MGRLKDFAKESKKETKQYPWKTDVDTFEMFKDYCSSLNMSVNEGLNKLVELELEEYKKEMYEEMLKGNKKYASKEMVKDDGKDID